MPNVDPPNALDHVAASEPLPIAPSMGALVRVVGSSGRGAALDARVITISALAILIGLVGALVAQLLSAAIALITNLSFFGRLSFERASPADNLLGIGVLVVPVLGAVAVGIMARYGSPAIRGHGIPEAMEQVLFNQSRIPARVLFLKPLSAVVSIGTGGPFGAEGPIIATGGALGSLVGQFVKTSADERKTLLAAGAAAGMSATFGSPVAAVLLAVELLLFEYRPRSLAPVVVASATAAGVRVASIGTVPAFSVHALTMPSATGLVGYAIVGLIAGAAAVGITRAVYTVEDGFARLPLHWMWWPALGAIPVGLIGLWVPHTMGVGYDNIEQLVSGGLTGGAIIILCVFKLLSWLFSLGSGTSGGTLAPLFTIGGGIGAMTSIGLGALVPASHVDPRMGALVGMAALFAAASRTPLTSVVFAFEATHQTSGLLPLLAGVGVAYLLSCVMMKTSIMTEKIVRRGRPIPSEYTADQLEQVLVSDVGLRPVVRLKGNDRVREVQGWLRSREAGTSHHGFPVVDEADQVHGVLTQRDIFASQQIDAQVMTLLRRPLIATLPTATLRDVADMMLREEIGRLPVMDGGRLVGIVTRSDLLEGHKGRLASAKRV